MLKRLILVIAVMIGILGFIYHSAFAYVIDGSLADWGVTPFTDWIPGSGNVDYVELDNVRPGGGAVWGGEPYDVEALYFDDDGYYLYFAMVTSFPMRGRGGVEAGDLALDLDGDLSYYEFAVRTRNMRLGYRQRRVRENPTWVNSTTLEANPIYIEPGTGTFIGFADIYYKRIGFDNGVRNWILEGRINRLMFSDVPQEGDQINLHWSMYCGNDYINLTGDFDTAPIPEPATLSLLGLGLVGLYRLKRKKS